MHVVRRESSPSYQLFMLALCIASLAGLVLERVYSADKEMLALLDFADNVFCAVFLFDFCLSLARAENRVRYFFTWGWVDLLSSIPTMQPARYGRIARIARLTRVLRAVRASRHLTDVLHRQRGKSVALAAALLALLLIMGSSAAILRLEDSPKSNIKSADDAVWWAFATITTVGYGEFYPATAEGRFIAALLMTAGVGLFSAFSAALAAWFLVPEDEATDAELTELRNEIAALRELIEKRLT